MRLTVNSLKNFIKSDDQKPINSHTIFVIHSIIAVIVFLGVTTYQFYKQTNTHKAEIIKEAKSTFMTSKQLYKNVLKRAFNELQKSKNYNEYHIQRVMARNYPLLQELKYKQDGEALFWISKVNPPVIIDYNSITHYSLFQDKFISRQNSVDRSYQANYIKPGVYVFCREVLEGTKHLAHLCVLQDMKWMIAGLSSLKRTDYDININDAGTEITFVALLNKPFLSYLKLLFSNSIFLFFWLLISFCSHRLSSKRHAQELAKIKNHNSFLSRQLQCLRVLEVENNERMDYVIPKIKKSKFSDISNQDIDIILNYFYQQIVEQKLSINYIISDEVKTVQCDVLLIHRLLMSLITESLYSIPQKSIVNIKFDVTQQEKHKFIKITYSDNSYALYSEEIIKKLNEHTFYIDKEVFHDNVYLAGGSMNETYMEYKEKGMEIILPCTDYKMGQNVVEMNPNKNNNESN